MTMSPCNRYSRVLSASLKIGGARKTPPTFGSLVVVPRCLAALGFLMWSRNLLASIAILEADGVRSVVVNGDRVDLLPTATRKSYAGGAGYES